MSSRHWAVLALGAISALALAAGLSAYTGGRLVGRQLLQTRGIWTEFDDPSSPNGWYSGELLHDGNFDPARPEVVRQLNAMRAMGVNEIAYELRSADPVWIPGERKPPECNVAPDTGLQWPQPTQEEVTNLGRLVDLVSAKGMRIALVLDNTHMEDRANSQRWLGAILDAVKGKRSLDYVAFGGDKHLIDLSGDGVPESCGGLSEAPLWLGPSSLQGLYVEWAIRLGISLGLPASQLTAESIVGFYPAEAQAPAGPEAQDNHLWSQIGSMRTIFDRLAIPVADRTYAISYYAHRKCSGFAFPFPCADEDPQAWAEETAKHVRNVTGPEARVTAAEFGDLTPVEPHWNTEKAVEGLGALMRRYGIDGGAFWHWEDVTGNAPSSFADPVKKRGSFSYYPVQRELADLYGFHLRAIPNGSFESRLRGWKLGGRGRALLTRLAEDAPWRGRSFLRLTTAGSVSVTSAPIRVSPSVVYTTTANLRFAWKAKSRPTTKLANRPQVDVNFRYLTCRKRASHVRAEDVFRYLRKMSTHGFRTFPLRYRTPKDACYVQIQLVAAGNRRALGMTVDVDNLR
jgi:hypothetical protein